MPGSFPSFAVFVSVLLVSSLYVRGAKAGPSVSPYDLGYAYQASLNCPGFKLIVPVPDEIKTNSAFKEGVAMVDHSIERLSKERTCKFARQLYDSKVGKTAKVLEIE